MLHKAIYVTVLLHDKVVDWLHCINKLYIESSKTDYD